MTAHQKSFKCRAKFLDKIIQYCLKNNVPPTPSSKTSLPPCPGASYSWELGSPYLTYLFSIHDPTSLLDAGYSLISIQHDPAIIRVRSNRCYGVSQDASRGCSSCVDVKPWVDFVQDRARKDPGKLPNGTISLIQLIKRLEDVKKAAEAERFQLLNTLQELKRLRALHSLWIEILELVGSNNVPALHRIFRNAKEQGWTLKMLLLKIHDAINGKYHAKNFSDFEYDLAALMYDLGGSSALYALHTSPFAFPCRSTIIDRRLEFKLRISCGIPKISDIVANINMMFKDIPPYLVGITLMLDEVACDARLVYLAENDDIAGLCEHVSSQFNSVKMGDNLDIMYQIAAAVRDGKVHIGQEVLVAAFARNDETGYGARPVLILPTCKRGDYEQAAMIIEKLRQAWRLAEYGEAVHGPIWSIASDGDPKRRPAMYSLCMAKEIQSHDPLFMLLGHLPGLNLMVGDHNETQDFDFKHEFKRLCKLLCTREGILIDNVIINRTLLAEWLERLTDIDWSEDTIFSLLNPGSSIRDRIEAILSPKDLQDVPRAIKLLRLVSSLRRLDTSNFDPIELSTHRALCLLGEMLDALIEPFINPDLSISQQITSLVAFAFIAEGLFSKHGSDFMPQHLYGDLQCMVRTAVFRVAHTKLLDPQRKVFLCLLGDDVLETLFGRSRMLGAHCPNVDVDQLRNRFGTAWRIDLFYQKYPQLEEKPYRLKLKRSQDVDHLSPRNWRGELSAASCDIQQCWMNGIHTAQTMFTSKGYNISILGKFFNSRLTKVDLLRPTGGRYPGISAEVDRSLSDITESLDDSENAVAVNSTSIITSLLSFRNYNGSAELKSERREAEQPFICSVWMKLTDGFAAHKKSIIRIIMDRNGDIDDHKSHDRLLRVRYHSEICDSLDISKIVLPENVNDDMFKLGSLFATLVCTCTDVSLAILKCTSIKVDSQLIGCAPAREVWLRDSSYDISGQILSLQLATHREGNQDSLCWVWDLHFVALDGIKRTSKKDATMRLQNLTISVNGQLVVPIQPSSFISTCSTDLTGLQNFPETMEKTSVLKDEFMCQIMSELVERVADDAPICLKIPLFGPVRTGMFPYQSSVNILGGTINVCHITTIISPPKLADAQKPCTICNLLVPGPKRQNHMGRHILCRIRGVEESNSSTTQVSLLYPCGFCGQSSVGGVCTVKQDRGLAISECNAKLGYAFQIKSAAKLSDAKPCTNVPMECAFCPRTKSTPLQWKYNMFRHLEERHPSWRQDYPPGSSKEIDMFIEKIHISEEEEARLGIPESKRNRWALVVNDMRDLQRTMQYIPTTHNARGDSPRKPTSARPNSRLAPIPLSYLTAVAHPSNLNYTLPNPVDLFSS